MSKRDSQMIIIRNNIKPSISSSARIASSAKIIGNVTIGERCYIDHNVVIESSEAPILIDSDAIVMTSAVIRSTGGQNRPSFPVHIHGHTLISPLCSIAGCIIGHNCYIATGVIIFQGASIGAHSRISVGAIVHFNTQLPPNSHVGIRHIAVSTESGLSISADSKQAHEWLAK